MALKKSLTKAEWDALQEPSRKFYESEKIYVADGENWKLADVEGVEDVSGLKSALEKERKARADFERDLKAERDKLAGIDLDLYSKLKSEAENKETDELKAKGQIDQIIEKKDAEKKQAVDAIQKKYDDLMREHNELRIDHRLRAAFEKGGVMADRIDDAVDLTKKNVKLTDKGELQILKDGSPIDASLDIYAKELLKEQKPWLYAASGAGGSGAQNGTNGAGGKKQYKRSEIDKQAPAVASAWMAEVRSGKADLVDQ